MGVREYTLRGVTDSKGRPIAEAWCRAYNSNDTTNLVLVETKYTDEYGNATFTALPDDAPVDISAIWGANQLWWRNIFGSTGDQIEQAVLRMHTQGTDTALGTQAENLDMGSHKVVSVTDPTADQDAATKKYVDAASDEADEIEIEELGAATYDDVQDWINNTQSAGYITGGVISNAGAGKINVSALTGFIKTTDSATGITKSFDLGAQSNLDILTDGKVNYTYVKFTAPSTIEVLATPTRSDIEFNRQFTLGRVYRSGTNLSIIQSGVQLTNFLREEHERLIATRWVERASGGVISGTGTRNIASTEGTFFIGRNETTTAAKDTSGTDKFTYWYHATSAWTSLADQTQIHNTQYDDGTDLATLTANRYGVHWVFIDYAGNLHVLYGQGNYKLTDAQTSVMPASLPDFLDKFATPAARIIIKKSATAFTETASAYERFFPILTTIDHGELSGLTDDDHTQYTLVDGTRAFTGEQSMGTHKIINVVDPTANQDAATKKYVDYTVEHGIEVSAEDTEARLLAWIGVLS